MKICYLIERAGPYHIFRMSALADHELSVIETNASSDQYAWKEKLDAGFPLFSPVLKNPLQLNELLDAQKPDVIFLTGYGFREMLWGLAWAIRNQVPVVMQSDSTEQDTIRAGWKERIKKYILSNVQAAFVAGTRSRKYLRALDFDDAAIFEPYDVVDNDFFSRPDKGLNPLNASYFVCISRLIRAKNLEFLIRTYALFNQQRPEKFRLVILGNGPLEESLKQVIIELNLESLVFIKGFLHMEEVRKYYQHATALILASTSEPWGLCINEAMAAGLPVISTEMAGASEDLIINNKTGWVFSPLDSESLIEAMKLCADLPLAEREILISNARERLYDYSIEKFVTGINNSASYAIEHSGRGKFKKIRSFFIYQIALLFS